jgi:hypothetical protein
MCNKTPLVEFLMVAAKQKSLSCSGCIKNELFSYTLIKNTTPGNILDFNISSLAIISLYSSELMINYSLSEIIGELRWWSRFQSKYITTPHPKPALISTFLEVSLHFTIRYRYEVKLPEAFK